jgi:hypothetical protein
MGSVSATAPIRSHTTVNTKLHRKTFSLHLRGGTVRNFLGFPSFHRQQRAKTILCVFKSGSRFVS